MIFSRYEVYMDENGDAEGNYTLVSRQRQPDASKGYGLFPAGRFTKLRNLTENPVSGILRYQSRSDVGRYITTNGCCFRRSWPWWWTWIGSRERRPWPSRPAAIAGRNASVNQWTILINSDRNARRTVWHVNTIVVFSSHRGNTVDRSRHAAVGVGRHLAGVLQELEVRTGTGQPAVEGRLQGHRNQRHREQQHLVQDIQSERMGGRDERLRHPAQQRFDNHQVLRNIRFAVYEKLVFSKKPSTNVRPYRCDSNPSRVFWKRFENLFSSQSLFYNNTHIEIHTFFVFQFTFVSLKILLCCVWGVSENGLRYYPQNKLGNELLCHLYNIIKNK